VTNDKLPLIFILGLIPFSGNFISPKSEYKNDDFPLPISPIMATNSPLLIFTLISYK
jgi:hypothetical protein